MSFWQYLSCVAVIVGLLRYFGLSWDVIRYRGRRFAEYPIITSETPTNSVVLFTAQCMLSGIAACAISIGNAWLFWLMVTTPLYPLPQFGASVAAVAVVLYFFSA